MELVIDKELLCVYFDLNSPKKKNDKELRLKSAIENEKNKIKISSIYCDLLESYFRNKSAYHLSVFQTFITSLSDEGRLISFKSENVFVNEDNELELIHNYEHTDYTFSLVKSTQSNNVAPNIKSNLSVYDNVVKPNKDWFILSLSSCFVFSMDYSDFTKQKELIEIFEFCSKLPRTEKKLYILDSYFTLNKSSVLCAFKANGLKTQCYTSSYLKLETQKTIIRSNIRSFFGQNTSIRFSSDKSIIHERKIMLGSLILDSTHDFSELTISNHNWSIYFVICDIKNLLFQEKIKRWVYDKIPFF